MTSLEKVLEMANQATARADRLQAQRDILLAALEAVLAVCVQVRATLHPRCVAARAVIARVRGQE